MIVFISGPITGVEDYQLQFSMIDAWLSAQGHHVYNPATLPPGIDEADAMATCCGWLCRSDAVFFMDGWERSKGCIAERAIADKLGLFILNNHM